MHYHFVGIGGVGMGTLASLILDKGYKVSGSDLKDSSLSIALRDRGAHIVLGHEARNVNDADFVVYSSAIRDDNPELSYAREHKIPILKRAQLLAQIMDNHVGITIAGAHGKTTTTSMVSRLLLDAGLNPSTAVGGIINGAAYNANLGAGKYFVAEVDESDGSFLYFNPMFSIITNIDYEHLDYYHTWENIVQAYEQFVARTHEEGLIIGCGDDTRLKEILIKSNRRYLTYGFSPVNDLHVQNMRFVNNDQCYWEFECVYHNQRLPLMQLSIAGQHNILNAMATIALGMQLKISPDRMAASLKSFSGVKRRFQNKGVCNEILIIDDYGHHPTEIIATIKTAHTVKKKRLLVVFQPHRYSRTKFLLDDFVKALMQADFLILTDIYAASEEPIEGVSAQGLVQKIHQEGKKDAVYLPKEQIVNYLLQMAKPGDLVLTLGAGDIYHCGDELIAQLRQQSVARLDSKGACS